MTPAEVALVLVAYSVFAVAAHEGTHWIAAEIYGRKPSIDWVGVECVWSVQDDAGARERAQDGLIRAMPVLVGIAVSPVALGALTGATTTLGYIRVWAWLVYTVPIPVPLVGGIGASVGDWLGLVALARRGGEAV
jgi:hypothetical protein